MEFIDTFSEDAAVLVVAAGVGALAFRLRQPLIIAFILVGVLLGPAGLDWVRAHDQVDLFAKLGIGLLLFVVGLKLDPSMIRSVGPVAAVTGFIQMTATLAIGLGMAALLDMESAPAFYVCAALMFSSTVIIVKLLSDKREIDSLHGRIVLGILIMQDIVVILLMIGVTAFGSASAEMQYDTQVLLLLTKGFGLLALTALLTRYVLPGLLHALARSPELLTLFAIAWAIGLASLSLRLGFSKEVGAFIAGVSLAATPYKAILGARLVSLRDFLLLFFFIDLGVQIDVSHLGAALGPAILFSLVVLLGKPLMVALPINLMGYSTRTSAVSGMTMGQISEFSLILAALGLSLGHIDESTVGLITLIGLITIGISTYMILYSQRIFEALAPWLTRPVGSARVRRDPDAAPSTRFDVILFGLGRYGRNLAQELKQRGSSVLGVDHDPERVRYWQENGLETLYGDIEDSELYHLLPLADADWIVCTVPGQDCNCVLLQALQRNGYEGRTALTADTVQHRNSLLTNGADIVQLPFRDAATQAAEMLLPFPTD